MILLFGKSIGQLGVVPKSESVVLPQSQVFGNFSRSLQTDPLPNFPAKVLAGAKEERVPPLHCASVGMTDLCCCYELPLA
ncbi:hypothetical protein HDF12_001298 [Edaphobacter lichenicola]|uniref:Uncharacterized protein n=1 Tax=Tunturiibacter lichenicola TaxID=2051959 RepID=A0A7Y9NLD7_9BACT|nr:hypothetical protein [Edaphobacter lichenicola]